NTQTSNDTLTWDPSTRYLRVGKTAPVFGSTTPGYLQVVGTGYYARADLSGESLFFRKDQQYTAGVSLVGSVLRFGINPGWSPECDVESQLLLTDNGYGSQLSFCDSNTGVPHFVLK